MENNNPENIQNLIKIRDELNNSIKTLDSMAILVKQMDKLLNSIPKKSSIADKKTN